MRLEWRPFAFPLPQPLRTARGLLSEKRGWLLRLQAPSGAVGWGEAAPLVTDPAQSGTVGIQAAIDALGDGADRDTLERALPELPPPLAFAFGAALAELDGWVGPSAGGWLPAPASAWLLPAGAAALPALAAALEQWSREGAAVPFTVKWKVATGHDGEERALLEQLLAHLPAGSRLRLDANGGWDRPTAQDWASRLAGEPRLEWLEQPLPPSDRPGLEQLAALLPVALDESLQQDPQLRSHWGGWQVRRPSQEGDPRPLLADLQAGAPRRVLSTAFETGIGRRWLAHLAALQQQGPTPTAPGLARGWCAGGPLFAADPERVWEAAA
jgi:o-succinylbenzoate synthase